MSEMAWMRNLQQACISNPDEAAVLAKMINNRFDKAQREPDSVEIPRELAWRQAYIHQLAKIAAGLEVAHFGPWVNPFPGHSFPLQPIFHADYKFDIPRDGIGEHLASQKAEPIEGEIPF